MYGCNCEPGHNPRPSSEEAMSLSSSAFTLCCVTVTHLSAQHTRLQLTTFLIMGLASPLQSLFTLPDYCPFPIPVINLDIYFWLPIWYTLSVLGKRINSSLARLQMPGLYPGISAGHHQFSLYTEWKVCLFPAQDTQKSRPYHEKKHLKLIPVPQPRI